LTNILVVPGWNENVNGFRRPSAQIARLIPAAEPKNGLSEGIVPSGLILRTLPSRVASVCEFAPLALSPTAT
jgi:hypothetical protein